MNVKNVHERELNAAAGAVGALIDSLSSPDDALWPVELWPRMKFDRPLGVGARGGHGPIRYLVEAYEPGRSVRFRFTGPRGFDGRHGLEVITERGRPVTLRHTLEMRTRGIASLTWPAIYRPLHDALLEDALAQGQASLGEAPDVRRWSIWVRVLRWTLTRGRARAQAAPRAPDSGASGPPAARG